MSLLQNAQGIEQLAFKEGFTATVPGQGRERRDKGIMAGYFAEIGFNSPQGNNKAGLNPIFPAYFCKQRQMLAI